MTADTRFLGRLRQVADHRDRRARLELREANDEHTRALEEIDQANLALEDERGRCEAERAAALGIRGGARSPKLLIAALAHSDHLVVNMHESERRIRELSVDAEVLRQKCEDAKAQVKATMARVRKVDVWTDKLRAEEAVRREVMAEVETDELPPPIPRALRIARPKRRSS